MDARDNVLETVDGSSRATRSSGPELPRPSSIKTALSGLQFPTRHARSLKNEKEASTHTGRRGDPLGLILVHEPDGLPSIDLVFVHGLGGTSRKTWCKDRDLDMFWPKDWLPYEPGMSSARIMSFGYNAHFSSRADKESVLNISDFAKDLLFSMKFATIWEERGPPIGKIPIVFVAHSMGGLVVKKAYILGQNDQPYQEIVQAVCGMVFLSTPHRGTDLAGMLNALLSASFAGFAPKQYIAELSTKSATLHEINEQFRNLAPKLSIVSMFETLPTNIGFLKTLILQKDSSTLGWPGEIMKPLDADHHDVCKYGNRNDPNYISVRNIIRHLVDKFQVRKDIEGQLHLADDLKDLEHLERFLGSMDGLGDDLEFFSEKQMIQSCRWFLEEPDYVSFVQDGSRGSGILWCTGPPGFGKSVLCSFLVKHLIDQHNHTSFYFFRFGDHSKNDLAKMLSSVAYQTAAMIPDYRKMILRLFEQGAGTRRMTTRVLWQKLFADALFKIHHSKPLYCIIDGLDECEEASVLLKCLQDLTKSSLVVKVIILSRRTHSLSVAFEKLAKTTPVQLLDLSERDLDLRLYVEEEMADMHGDDDFKQKVKNRLLQKAQGNFLWASLVTGEILDCHTEEAVREALEAVPSGLEDLYQRMDNTLKQKLRSGDHKLALTIFQWTVCSQRGLLLDELREALVPDHGQILDLRFTIGKVCGDFLVVDRKETISMIHLTAKDFLTQIPHLHFHISEKVAHQRLLLKCLSAITAFDARMTRGTSKVSSFLLYASMSWPFHLEMGIDFADQESLTFLAQFFSVRCVLSWIYVLASSRKLRVLIYASKVLTLFIKTTIRLDEERSPLLRRLQDRELLIAWATDLVRLVGKFAPQLTSSPKLIFGLIPPFCPPDSAIHKQFATTQSASSINIHGLANISWDVCVAKFAAPGNATPLGIRCIGGYLAMMMSNGTIIFYYSDTLEEARRITHGERVLAWSFNVRGDRLATSSLSRTIVWNVSTAKEVLAVPHLCRTEALAIVFATGDSSILICTDDWKIQRAFLEVQDHSSPKGEFEDSYNQGPSSSHFHNTGSVLHNWQLLDGAIGDDILGGESLASLRCVEFNSEGTQVAVSYRDGETALSVWSLEAPYPNLIGRCRSSGSSQIFRNTSAPVIQDICWNNVTGHVLGIVWNTRCAFKWHPFSGEYAESSTFPVGCVVCSPDGKFFVTGSRDGFIRIWDFNLFSVVHQLSCNILVTDLAIDPMDARIYDIRENFCSVWSPSALIRMWDVDDKAIDTQSAHESSTSSLTISEALYNMAQPITSLALNHEDLSFATGNHQGNVTCFSSKGERIQSLVQGFMTIRPMCWSDDGKYCAYSDVRRQIQVQNLSESAKPAVNVLMVRESFLANQLLLSPDSQYLLAASERFVNIWSTEQRKRTCTSSQTDPNMIWVNSPDQPSHVIGLGYSSIQISRWSDFADTKSIQLLRGPDAGLSFNSNTQSSSSYDHIFPSEIRSTVDKVLLTLDGQIALVQTSQVTSQRQKKQFMIIHLGQLHSHDTISAQQLHPTLQESLLLPLGFVTPEATHPATLQFSAQIYTERRRSSGTLTTLSRTLSPPGGHHNHIIAFLDKDFWVCTYQLNDPVSAKVRRHYFLPRDWLNMEWLELAIMRPDGALLCPRNGEVAVVMHGLGEEWID